MPAAWEVPENIPVRMMANAHGNLFKLKSHRKWLEFFIDID
jgi:hypothetical protein